MGRGHRLEIVGAGVTVGMNPFNLSNTWHFVVYILLVQLRIAKVKRIHSHGNTSTYYFQSVSSSHQLLMYLSGSTAEPLI